MTVLRLLILGIVLQPFAAFAADPQRPNVLMIAIDDLNDWVSPLAGHPQVKTPWVDRLAARGMTFTNAHCQSPLCNPSRTSLMTGLRPGTTGIYGLAPWFRSVPQLRDRVTLPQAFKAAGYETLTTGKIYHGGYPPREQRDAEFDHWGPGSSVGARPEEKLVQTPGGNHPLVDWGTFPHRDEDKGDWKVADWAVERLDQLGSAQRDEPFFMAVGFFLPHVPCYATQKWFDLYPEDELILPPVLDDDRNDTPMLSWYLHWQLPEPRLSWLRQSNQWRPLVRAYLASISFVDSQVGRVLEALEQAELDDNTIVVLWSDHGWHLGEKLISGKNSLWDPSTRVPLIFAGPGVAHGICAEPAELLDLYPTLAQMCNVQTPADLEGHSLVPQLQDPNATRLEPAITTHNQGNHGIRTRDWRYIRYADASEELYDMRNDVEEWTNVIANPDHAGTLRRLRSHLPESNLPPVPGSQHRILVQDDDSWVWEGDVIDPQQLER